MLSGLELVNFKRYGPEGLRIPLAPLTLILGANASGKSSIIQALLALRQSWERSISGFAELRTQGADVTLGRYGNVVHDHSDAPVLLTLMTRQGNISFFYNSDGNSPENLLRTGELDGFIIETPEGARLDFIPLDQSQPHQIEFLVAQESWEHPLFMDESEEERECRELLREGHGAVVLCFDELEQTRSLRLDELIPNRASYSSEQEWEEAEVAHRSTFPKVEDLYRSRLKPRFTSVLDRTLFRTRKLLHDIRYIGPTRHTGKGSYRFDNTGSDRVGATGHRLGEVLWAVPDKQPQVNAMLDEIGVPYQVLVRDCDTVEQSVECLLEDRRGSPAMVGIGDVGFGVSQLLPILSEYHAIRVGGGVLIVEQPELHLHPDWQIRLLRLLASHIRKDYSESTDKTTSDRQVILEIHSELMVLAAQQLVRLREVDAKDICILVAEVEDTEGVEETLNATITRIDLDDQGEPRIRWPKGFFPYRSRLLFDEDTP